MARARRRSIKGRRYKLSRKCMPLGKKRPKGWLKAGPYCSWWVPMKRKKRR